MKKTELLNNVKELGFPLFEIKKSMDVNKTLAKVTKSKDSRLWEGFPLLLANTLERGLFNYREALRNFKNYVRMKDDFEFEYSLSQLFSNKQKELFMKKLKGEKMTKTESEYFSRSVKKKVVALANSDLHKLATTLIKK